MCVHPHTLDDGVIGHCLHASSVIIKRKVPHPWVQVLDESGLVDRDRVIKPCPRVWFAQSPILFGDKPATVQQLHKVILQKQQREEIPAHEAVVVISMSVIIKPDSKEAREIKKFCMQLVIFLTAWQELCKVVMQDAARTGLCTEQIFEKKKCWFFSDSYLELFGEVFVYW